MLDSWGSWAAWAKGRRRLLRPIRVVLCAVLTATVIAGCFSETSEREQKFDSARAGELAVPGSPNQPNQKTGAASESGSGSGRSSSGGTAAFIAEADNVCAKAQPKINRYEQAAQIAAKGGDFGTAADQFEKGVAQSERELADLRGLAAPAEIEAKLDEMYAGIELSNRLFRSSLDDLRSGRIVDFNALGNRARAASFPSQQIARELNFEVCGSAR
jgi:hypothetical protein